MLKRIKHSGHALVMIAVLLSLYVSSRNMIIGRYQLALLPESDLRNMASREYRQFLCTNSVLSPQKDPGAAMVERIGRKLESAVSAYLEQRGMQDAVSNYHWEFNLVDSPDANAWCLPGGKVVVYTGLVNMLRSETLLAVVMGHEIAHAVARHGNERMTYSMITNGMGIAGSIITSGNRQVNTIFERSYGSCAEIGILLPNSRKQELEADRFGLIFLAMAGYDPRESVTLWKKMKASTVGRPPEFRSTHPTEENRIKELQRFMPRALSYFKQEGQEKVTVHDHLK